MESGKKPNPPLPSETNRWNVEYQFRTIFHVSHDEFMDTPLDEVKWLMNIHKVHMEAKAKAQAKERQSQGGA